MALELNYRGRVQGVGFRRKTAAIAGDYAVAGYVRNLDDGSVELRVEGESAEVERFLAAVAERFERNIVEQTRTAVPSSGFTGFAIRR